MRKANSVITATSTSIPSTFQCARISKQLLNPWIIVIHKHISTNTEVAVLSQAPSSSTVPDGKYGMTFSRNFNDDRHFTNTHYQKIALFISTKNKPAPIGVIAAFLNAKESLISSGRIKKIKINLVDKDNEILPRMHTPNKMYVFLFSLALVSTLQFSSKCFNSKCMLSFTRSLRIWTKHKHQHPVYSEISGNYNVTRLLYRISGQQCSDLVEVTSIDAWIGRAIEVNKMNKDEFKKLMNELNEYLTLRSVLVGYDLTACDISLYSALKRSELWQQISSTVSPPHHGPINVMRWFTMIDQSQCIQAANDFIVKFAEKAQKKQACCKKSKEQKKSKNKNKSTKQQNQRNTKQKGAASASWVLILCEIYRIFSVCYTAV